MDVPALKTRLEQRLQAHGLEGARVAVAMTRSANTGDVYKASYTVDMPNGDHFEGALKDGCEQWSDEVFDCYYVAAPALYLNPNYGRQPAETC